MADFAHLTAADARKKPWRNGRGVTEEIAIGPEGASFEAGDFDWRVSRAVVVEAGPFSSFEGFDRVLVVTEGEGLVLTHGADTPPVVVRPFAPYAFRGEGSVSATLVGGPVRDFNVMTRRSRCRAELDVLHLRGDRTGATFATGDALIYVASGVVTVREGGGAPTWTLRPGESLLARGIDGPRAFEFEGGGASVLIGRFHAAPPAFERNGRTI